MDIALVAQSNVVVGCAGGAGRDTRTTVVPAIRIWAHAFEAVRERFSFGWNNRIGMVVYQQLHGSLSGSLRNEDPMRNQDGHWFEPLVACILAVPGQGIRVSHDIVAGEPVASKPPN